MGLAVLVYILKGLDCGDVYFSWGSWVNNHLLEVKGWQCSYVPLDSQIESALQLLPYVLCALRVKSQILKETVPRDFRLQVFFHESVSSQSLTIVQC